MFESCCNLYGIVFSKTSDDGVSSCETVLYSMALVRERTIPTERPPPVGEVSANFADRGVSRGQRNGSPRSLDLYLLNKEQLLIYSSSSSIDLN
jgi:hypothetical protein